jgi:hypothetical protein
MGDTYRSSRLIDATYLAMETSDIIRPEVGLRREELCEGASNEGDHGRRARGYTGSYCLNSARAIRLHGWPSSSGS